MSSKSKLLSTKKPRQKRQTKNLKNSEMVNKDSIDLCNDVSFLISYINSNNIFLWLLLSGQITSNSFTNLYKKSIQIGWKQVFIDERSYLKLDEKSKLKRIMFNRLIYECIMNPEMFDDEVKKLNETMKQQISDVDSFLLVPIHVVYAHIDQWKQLQCERRLFFKEYNHLYSLITLQQQLTNYFIQLIEAIRHNPNVLSQGGEQALIELFNHCMIIVVQPSGTDCIGVMKYEKVGNAFMAKIKSRIICLLDPERIQQYLEISSVGITLYLKDRKDDPSGDIQSPLQWQIRTIICNENQQRKFLYVELNESDSIVLNKLNTNRKPLYNKKLCQLEFQIKFKLIGFTGEIPVILNSQLFGLCSHGKFSPEHLTKVFLDEIKRIYTDVQEDTHINVLTTYLDLIHKRMCGIEIKSHTKQLIHDELTQVYTTFTKLGASPNGPVVFLTLDLYETTIKKFITQVKFLNNHPFLSMMYSDSLFLGICNDSVDQQLNANIHTNSYVIIRFAAPFEQETTENPNIILAIYNGALSKARITHDYLIADITTCICEAAENRTNQLQIFAFDKILPFSYLSQYYDSDLSRENVIQTNDAIRYYSLKTLFRNTIRNNSIQSQISVNGEQNFTYSCVVTGQFSGNIDRTSDLIAFLQEQTKYWCQQRGIQGSLVPYLFSDDVNADYFNEILPDNSDDQ